MTPIDVAIVGAGPAGMAAAIVVAEHGGHPWLIDESHGVGGQIYRQELPTSLAPGNSSPDHARGERLKDRLGSLADRVHILTGTGVWGIFPPRRLAVSAQGGWQMIDSRHLILATGAFEYVPSFPGWTLPGVMTPGAAQSIVKTMGVKPGRRVVIAGSGPFLLVVALQLVSAGVEVAAVVESATRTTAWRHASGLLARPGLLLQGMRYLRALHRAGVPLLWGRSVVRACGEQEVRSVEIAPCDRLGRIQHGRKTVFEADTLAVGYGFVPRTDLAQLCGCQMRCDESLGGWVPQVDGNLRTTVDGVSVAGDGGGVAGALAAELEGRLAGLDVARQLNLLDEASFRTKARSISKQLVRLRSFAQALHRIYGRRPGAGDLTDDDTIVCRCEELTRRQIEAAIEYGGTNLRTLKVMTRLGMGPCQGRMCWPAVARLIATRRGETLESVGLRSVRPPIIPLAVSDLSQAASLCGTAAYEPVVKVPR